MSPAMGGVEKALAGLALLVLLVLVGTPYARHAWQHYRVESSVGDLVADLARARQEAVGRNRVVRVAFREAARTWAVDEATRERLPDGVGLAGPQRDILFFPDGTSSGGQVVVSARDEAWALAVDLATGSVRPRHAEARPPGRWR